MESSQKPPVRLVACPSCGKKVPFSSENLYRPFCSERCKTTDLGTWAQEKYRIATNTPANLVQDPQHEDEENE